MTRRADLDRATDAAGRTLERVRGYRDDFVRFVSDLCRIESPTDHPGTQSEVHALLGPAFEELGFVARTVPGRTSGDHLLVVPKGRERHRPKQLLIGHTDTVWPVHTLDRMPVVEEGDALRGPGTLDMKGGLAMMVFALRAIRESGEELTVAPFAFVNADEEIGSPDSRRHVARVARAATRALVLEPALGEQGYIKTARKGVGRFVLTITGRAAHAGLEPEAGRSAVLEMSYVIRTLHDLNDPDRGITVNVGVVSGGTRANVVPALAMAEVDVRVRTAEDGRTLSERIHSIRPVTPDVRISVSGGIVIPPLERTPRNRRLWSAARDVGGTLGFDLQDAMAGGGSDGNTTSLYTATLDGLGCVGDGAHADHEHIEIEPTLDRCALLARLLLAPATDAPAT